MLVTIGGAPGGFLGMVGMLGNIKILRGSSPKAKRIVSAIFLTIGVYVLLFLLAGILNLIFKFNG